MLSSSTFLRRVSVLVAAVAIGVTACGDDTPSVGTTPVDDTTVTSVESGASDTTSPPDTLPAPNPASIDVTLDDGAVASETIGFSGGVVSATGADGTTFTLTVPEGALFDDVEITMTPLAGASGDPIGDSPVFGVSLEPEGLHFLGAATLEISGDAVPPDPVGFGAGREGDNFYLIPAENDDTRVSIPILHFSVAGIGQQQLVELGKSYTPVSPARQVSQVSAFVFVGPTDSSSTGPSMLRTWGELLVGSLNGSQGTQTLENLTVDLIQWSHHLSQYLSSQDENERSRFESRFEDLVRRLLLAWVDAVDRDVTRLFDECRSGEAEKGFDIARWWTIGTYLVGQGPSTEFDSQLDEWVNDAKECLTFRFRWKATVDAAGGQGGMTTTGEASAVVPGAFPTVDYILDLLEQKEVYGETVSALEVAPGGPFGRCAGNAETLIEIRVQVEIRNMGDVGDARVESMSFALSPFFDEDGLICPDLRGEDDQVLDTFFTQPLVRSGVSSSAGELFLFYELDIGPHDDGSFARFKGEKAQDGWKVEVEIVVETP